MNQGENIKLYWGSGSAPSWRVLICLAEKNLTKAETQLLSFEKKEHKSDALLKLNSRGQLPTFTDEEAVIHESIGICMYLELTYKQQGESLLPNNSIALATVLQRINEVDIIYIKCMDIARYYFGRKAYYSEAIIEKKITAFRAELSRWNNYVSHYIAGTNFTMADIIFFPVLAFTIRLGLSLDNYENLQVYYDKLRQRESIINNWPPHWKTSKDKTFFKDI
ncbi:hypothetical protein DID76_04625 [Candidatus Marinamargulisbacteria bacterium SCGC AG-414-C22]|nr:hypothetical protein DID76_04625 [Candidatus Marinamargulisbacteria bacterium SCGC AG-414-C22]